MNHVCCRWTINDTAIRKCFALQWKCTTPVTL